MTVPEFSSIDSLWKWMQDYCLFAFRFLVNDFGFEISVNRVDSKQFSLEFRKGNVTIGLWSEYGSRPEVFVKSSGRRAFTNQLIAKHARGFKLPVKATVFEERICKSDYQELVGAYAELIKVALTAR